MSTISKADLSNSNSDTSITSSKENPDFKEEKRCEPKEEKRYEPKEEKRREPKEEKKTERKGFIRDTPYESEKKHHFRIDDWDDDNVIVVKKHKRFEREINYLMDKSQWKSKKEYREAARDIVNALTDVPNSENEIIVMYKTNKNGVRKYKGLYFLNGDDTYYYGIGCGEMEYNELMRDIDRYSQCEETDEDDSDIDDDTSSS